MKVLIRDWYRYKSMSYNNTNKLWIEIYHFRMLKIIPIWM